MKKIEKTVSAVVDNAIKDGKIVGAGIVVSQHGKIIYEKYAGFSNRENKQMVTNNTQFRLASMTKPIVTAAALSLLEKGVIALDGDITKWLPEFRPKLANGKTPVITVRHLLTHTAGLTYGFLSEDNEPYLSAGVSDGIDDSVLDLKVNLARIATIPLAYMPGTNWCYSVATDVLGAVLESACQKLLADIVEETVTSPLGMRGTGFTLQNTEHLATAYAHSHESIGVARPMQSQDQVRLEGCGNVYYAPGRITNSKAYASGGAGLAGTARDYLTFLECMRKGGQPILQGSSVALMTEDAVAEFDIPAAGPGFGYGMGFAVLRNASQAQTPRHGGSYDWGGVYGTKMFVDPELGISAVMLTNTALEGLTGQFPVDITNAIYETLI